MKGASVFKFTSLFVGLLSFATRHAFADFDTLCIAGLAVAVLWIMQAQEAVSGSGWSWVNGLVGATVLPVHGLLLAGIVAGPTLFTKNDTPHFVSTSAKTAATATAGGGCGGAGGCGSGRIPMVMGFLIALITHSLSQIKLASFVPMWNSPNLSKFTWMATTLPSSQRLT